MYYIISGSFYRAPRIYYFFFLGPLSPFSLGWVNYSFGSVYRGVIFLNVSQLNFLCTREYDKGAELTTRRRNLGMRLLEGHHP